MQLKLISIPKTIEASTISLFEVSVILYKTGDNSDVRVQQAQVIGKLNGILLTCKSFFVNGVDVGVHGKKIHNLCYGRWNAL